MQDISTEVAHVFGNKVRVRVCGILVADTRILLINHQGLNQANQFWSPPGGGIQFGEPATQSLVREFEEETGLTVEIIRFLFVNEFISRDLHAIELFFEVKAISGKIMTGKDPELAKQIIKEVRFMTMAEIKERVTSEVHSIFHRCKNLQDLLLLQSYLTSR